MRKGLVVCRGRAFDLEPELLDFAGQGVEFLLRRAHPGRFETPDPDDFRSGFGVGSGTSYAAPAFAAVAVALRPVSMS